MSNIKSAICLSLRKEVKTKLEDPKVKNTLEDMSIHFRISKWDLCYHLYKDSTGLDGLLFDQLLVLKKYKIKVTNGKLLITKGSK
jgi:hypothetical protein